MRTWIRFVVAMSLGGFSTGAAEWPDWLVGTWQRVSSSSEVVTTEQWIPARGDMMLGTSQTVKAGRTVAYEFMRLVRDDAGGFVLVASPSGQAETTFVRELDAEAPGVWRFVNRGHDFPQWIRYQRSSDDAMVAVIGGPKADGGERTITFSFTRVNE